jgi:hypothetical protein
MVLAIFTVELKGIGAETDGDIMHCQPWNAQYDGVLEFCNKKGKHFRMVLDGGGETGNIGDISRGDRAAINDVDLAGGSEA